MAVKPGYKQTQAGVLPEDWDAVPLEAIASHVGDGLHGTPVYSSNGGYFFINGNNLKAGRIVITGDTQSVDQSEFTKHRKPLSDRSILMSINGTIGNLGLFDGEPVVLGKSVAYINVKLGTSKLFVYHSLQTRVVRQQFFEGLTGSTIGNLGLATIRRTHIPLPALEVEQRAIAGALSDADALLGALDRLLAKKRDLKQATMQQLLTGQTRLPGFHGKWQQKDLSAVCSMNSGEGVTSADIDAFSKYPCYGGNGLRGFTSRFTHDGDYALIGRQGALCGNVVGVGGKFFASEHAVVVTAFAHSDVRWLTYVLGRMNLNQYSESSAQPGLSVSKVLKLAIVVPPTKSEQTAIAEVLSDMDAELAALEQRRAKTQALKQGMMQELLTGRTRLV